MKNKLNRKGPVSQGFYQNDENFKMRFLLKHARKNCKSPILMLTF